MKITRVESIVLNLPMVIDGATPMLGGQARTSIDMLLVRIDTDAGVTGWGEAHNPPQAGPHRDPARAWPRRGPRPPPSGEAAHALTRSVQDGEVVDFEIHGIGRMRLSVRDPLRRSRERGIYMGPDSTNPEAVRRNRPPTPA